jgi:nitrogen fixation protein NifU and related proteins
MSDLRELYQEVIFDHNRNPRNFGRPAHFDRVSEGFNPLCGDRLTLYIVFDAEGRVAQAAFEGQGCAISTASASLMTEALKGRSEAEAEALFQQFHALVMGTSDIDPALLGKLQVLGGVREFPARVKCATLAWHTLHAALHGAQQVSTE